MGPRGRRLSVMRVDAFLRYQISPLALVNQSSFLLASITLLHVSSGFSPPFQFPILWLSAILAIVGLQNTMDPTSQTQDLASILRTLAAYAPPPLQAPQVDIYGATNIEEGEYEPSESYDPSQPLLSTPYPQPQVHHQPSEPQQHFPPQRPSAPPAPAPQPQKPPATPTTDPTTITTWPPALRHITSRTTSDPDYTHRISHLIQTQHQHERQWWTCRLDLVSKLENRDAKKRKLDSVLTSIGGNVLGPSNTSDLPPEKELEIFDRKVHRACREMATATTKELGRLEVPFFCTRRDLVVGKGVGEGVKRKGMVGEEELVRLQGKMLELLEDLCGEEKGEGQG